MDALPPLPIASRAPVYKVYDQQAQQWGYVITYGHRPEGAIDVTTDLAAAVDGDLDDTLDALLDELMMPEM